MQRNALSALNYLLPVYSRSTEERGGYLQRYYNSFVYFIIYARLVQEAVLSLAPPSN
jgi:hypothetical protein